MPDFKNWFCGPEKTFLFQIIWGLAMGLFWGGLAYGVFWFILGLIVMEVGVGYFMKFTHPWVLEIRLVYVLSYVFGWFLARYLHVWRSCQANVLLD